MKLIIWIMFQIAMLHWAIHYWYDGNNHHLKQRLRNHQKYWSVKRYKTYIKYCQKHYPELYLLEDTESELTAMEIDKLKGDNNE